MPWPGTTEFTDAIQNPGVCFRGNTELANGQVAVYDRGGLTGMPVVASGQFACVYKLNTGNREVAVRCFTSEVKDQQQRYEQLSTYLQGVLPESFVDFRYVEQGILVKGRWYPIVRMGWASGDPLNKFVLNNLDNPEAIAKVAARWLATVATLRGLEIAHNDLQHGNVMVRPDGLIRLVDYDGIFLPDFQGQSSPETGHKNYQHPQRTASNYNHQIDNFPALVIYLSLLALKADRSLWDRFYNDDNLLLTQKDYGDPRNSKCLQALKQSPDAQVKTLATRLEEYCALPVEQVPNLVTALRGAPAASSPPRTQPTTGAQGVPDSGGYREMLQKQAAPVPKPSPQPVPAGASSNNLVKCPKCGRNNDQGLIYCVDHSCTAPLSSSAKTCPCQASIPANARYCPQCGLSQTASTTAHASTGQPAAVRGRPSVSPQARQGTITCPNCRAQNSINVIYCIRCGTNVR
ncbi:MAG: hypothetical protein F4Z87_03195 [Gammaproteobacteria bacterium]|nr:hypothetical protein [Gammaproteobacteria bacterium]